MERLWNTESRYALRETQKEKERERERERQREHNYIAKKRRTLREPLHQQHRSSLKDTAR